MASSTVSTSAELDRAIGDPAVAGHDLDHRLEPVHPARAVADDLDLELALDRRGGDRGCDLVGADGDRRGIARNVNAKRAHRSASASSVSSFLASRRADDPAVEHGRRGHRAQAEAIDRLERDAPVRRGVADRDAQPCLGMRGQRIAAGRLAGLGAAELEHVPAGRRAPEVMVEGDDAVHLGAGDVQRLGDHRLGGFVDIAELLLQSVQDRQQRTLKAQMLSNDLRGSFRAPWFVSWHVSTSSVQPPHRLIALKILEPL